MPAVDRRLLRASRAARAHLLWAVVLGCATVVVIVAQASLLAEVIARAFLGGASLGELQPELLMLLVVIGLRALLSAVDGRHLASPWPRPGACR